MEPVHLQVTSLSLLSSFRHANQLRSHLWTFVCLKVFENPTTIMKAKEKNRNFRLYFPGGGTEAEERSEISFKVAIPNVMANLEETRFGILKRTTRETQLLSSYNLTRCCGKP